MADAGSFGRLGAIAELLFVRGRNQVLRVVVTAVVAVACCVLGVYSLDIQSHFAAVAAGGRLSTFLAHGSTAATAWTGWAAALFFGIALLRVRRGAPEPPGGRTPVEALTATQLRAGLVREYTAVRIALTVLSAATLTDVVRAARYIVATATGDSVASTSVTATVIEALGLVAATVVLALWTIAFRRQLVRVGALIG